MVKLIGGTVTRLSMQSTLADLCLATGHVISGETFNQVIMLPRPCLAVQNTTKNTIMIETWPGHEEPVKPGDWIVRGQPGGVYPVGAKMFEACYRGMDQIKDLPKWIQEMMTDEPLPNRKQRREAKRHKNAAST